MEFCVISPSAGLERYATLSKRHLVLAHVHDPAYELFYVNRRKEGDTIILDNGAYEGNEPSESQIIGGIRLYNPQIVVLPDRFLCSWEETYNAAKRFLDKYYNQFPHIKWMYVPQAPKGQIMNWIDGLINACDDFPLSYIGIPRCLATDISLDPLIRPQACTLIRNRWPHLKVHALGMVKGNVAELPFLRQAGCESIDSSAPVWRAWTRGIHLGIESEDREWDRIGTDVDFTRVEGMVEHNWVILKNLEACGVDTSPLRASAATRGA